MPGVSQKGAIIFASLAVDGVQSDMLKLTQMVVKEVSQTEPDALQMVWPPFMGRSSGDP